MEIETVLASVLAHAASDDTVNAFGGGMSLRHGGKILSFVKLPIDE